MTDVTPARDRHQTSDSGGRMAVDDLPARMARVEQRVTDLDLRMSALAPVLTTVTELSVHVATLRTRFDEFSKKIDERDEKFEQREDDNRRERKVTFRWAVGLSVMLLTGLASLAVAIITAGGHP